MPKAKITPFISTFHLTSSIIMKKTDQPIIIEETYTTSLATLWNALTTHSLMVQWYFDNIPNFIPQVGFTTSFATPNEDRTFTHLWEITEVVPQKRISYNWQYDEHEGDSFITFELVPLADKVMLRVIVTVLADFPDNIPEFETESCRMGWQYFLGLRLKEFLKK